GNVRITISAEGYEPSVLDFELPEGLVDLGVRTLEPVSNEPLLMTGTVVDSQTDLPIHGATVNVGLESDALVLLTDELGVFSFEAAPDTIADVNFSAAGYIGSELTVFVDVTNTELSVRLRPEGFDSALSDLRVHSVARASPASDSASFHVSGTVEVAMTLMGTGIDAPSVTVAAFHDRDV